jgi:hypothetical protein
MKTSGSLFSRFLPAAPTPRVWAAVLGLAIALPTVAQQRGGGFGGGGGGGGFGGFGG